MPEPTLPPTPETPPQEPEASTAPTPGTSGWLHNNLRPLIALALTLGVCYLAYIGYDQARAAIVAVFATLTGHAYAERAALRIPGKDH
jgi:hypothetical protein